MAISYRAVVKNLPWETKEEDITKFFGVSAADVEMLTWSNSQRCRGTAFINCADEEDFNRLMKLDGQEFECGDNNRQLQVVKYEERPAKPKKQNNPSNNRKQKPRRNQNNSRNNNKNERPPRTYEANEDSNLEVYVSNIPWAAKKADFETVFGDCGEIVDVTIPRLYITGRPKGFAFVRFGTVQARDKALEKNETKMGCVDKDGKENERVIGVRENKGRSTSASGQPRQRREREEREKPENCTTLFVGNLPWETDEERLKEVFSTFGAVQQTRIVRQSYTNRSRGFGYVEFSNSDAVDSAVSADLNEAGRKLRLDFATSPAQESS